MAATAPSRSARSTAPGVSNGTSAAATRRFARVMRCSMALSLTRKARAISLTDEAGDDAQRERDLLGRRQVGMAADEQEAQHVVAIVRAVEPLGEVGLGIVEIGDDLVGRQRLALAAAAHVVERDVAPDQDEPGGRDRAAARSAARSSARAGRPPGTPPRRGRDRGNSAAARATACGRAEVKRRIDPGEVGHPRLAPGQEQLERPDLECAAFRRGRSGARRRSPRRGSAQSTM